MKTSRYSLCLLLSVILPFITPAYAQTDQNAERLDRIEHDVMLLQRQISRGDGSGISASGVDNGPPVGSSAQLEVRLTAIEEGLRDLRGKVEENQFQLHKLSDALEKQQRDTDFRFNELGNAPPPPHSDAPPVGSAGADPTMKPLDNGAPGAPADPNAPKPLIKPLTDNPVVTAPPPADAGTQSTVKPLMPPPDGVKPAALATPAAANTPPAANAGIQTADAPEPTSFATPRDHYNYAFRLMNQTQYDQAAVAFDSFAKKYPKDPLIGNAYYWEGETYYIRRDYVTAADFFRQGFESMPDGPKAADNLLKLAMSLDALSRDKEACVVLQQVSAKFKKTATNTVQKADAEQKRIGCK